MRHPHWGVVEPAYFIPDDSDPHFHALSKLVISQAIADWRNFVTECGPMDISINLPISFLQNAAFVEYLYQSLPEHPASDGLIIEVNGADVIENISLSREIAKQGRISQPRHLD